ncbi:hypothetical protein [Desmospora activa]|uniref:Tfp pilus assembly protein PilN n=1 Tax=Desmospora activa DSM 45169 TaxID=1121389 RepID=A0A2T4ZDR8_9BACL|nr:hypothetical protein [Desmospora activa]PTM60035.1 hypothetical protein C8J48_2674 [Desmospora activa DSM 45169]
MNLLPQPPAGRRYFTLGLVIVLLWLLHFAGFAYWLIGEQREVEQRLEAEAKSLRDQQREAERTVRSHQAFMNQHGTTITYRDAVDALRDGRLIWQDGLNAVYDTLPANVSPLRMEANGSRLDGWVMFASPPEAVDFLESLQEQNAVEDVSLRCLGRQCDGVSPLPEEEGDGQMLHFQLKLRQASPVSGGGDREEGGGSDGS